MPKHMWLITKNGMRDDPMLDLGGPPPPHGLRTLYPVFIQSYEWQQLPHAYKIFKSTVDR